MHTYKYKNIGIFGNQSMTLVIENTEKFSLLNHSFLLSAAVFHDMEEKAASTSIFIQKRRGKKKN